MPCIRINDSQEGFLSFDMRDVLKILEPIGPTLEWYILCIDGRTQPGGSFSIVELDRETTGNIHGKKLTWMHLKDLASQLIQTYDCIIAGIPAGQHAPQLPLEPKYREDKVIIVAFDSTFWTVCVPQPEIARQLQNVFQDTRVVEIVETPNP